MFPLLYIGSDLLLTSFSLLKKKNHTNRSLPYFRAEIYASATNLDYFYKTLILFVDYSGWLLLLPLPPADSLCQWHALHVRRIAVENRRGNNCRSEAHLMTTWSLQCYVYGSVFSAPLFSKVWTLAIKFIYSFAGIEFSTRSSEDNSKTLDHLS